MHGTREIALPPHMPKHRPISATTDCGKILHGFNRNCSHSTHGHGFYRFVVAATCREYRSSSRISE